MGLDTVELVLLVENRFSIEIPDESAAKTETVGQLAALVVELNASQQRHLSYQNVLIILQQLIASEFAIPIEKIKPDSNFTKDLGLD